MKRLAADFADIAINAHLATHQQAKYSHIAHHPLTIALDDANDYHDGQIVDLPSIHAVISLADDALWVSFFIEKSSLSTAFAPTAMPMATLSDYLWENHCLELFFKQADNPAYTEINAAPHGHYAIYAFDDYRSPDVMPPVASHDFSFHWQAVDTVSLGGYDFYQYSFYITPADKAVLAVSHYQLSAIIYLSDNKDNKLPVYYAIRHHNPPDFHAAAAWASAI